MAVSIIIPTLNEAAIASQAVAHSLAAGPFEVIVADGGSSDYTVAVTRAAGANIVLASRGRASQQNAAARVARGDTLLFLHADAQLAPDGVRQIERALADPQVGCGAFKQSIDASGWIYRLLEDGNAWRAEYRGLPYGDQGIFIRRELFEDLGGFPEVTFMEDVFFMRRLRRRTWPVLLPGPLIVSARHWQHRGAVRQTLLNWSLLAAARFGIHPDRLADFYK